MPIAILVALSLPTAWEKEARRLNAALPDMEGQLPLACGQATPHLTLTMGVVEEDRLPTLADSLSDVLQTFTSFTLVPSYLYLQRLLSGAEEGLDVSGLAISPDRHLQELHKLAHEALLDAGWQLPTMGALPDQEQDNTATLRLIKNYRESSTYGHYFPHVTLGLGSLPAGEQWHGGAAILNRVVIFRMGNLCTAREELFSVILHAPEEIATGGF